MAELKDKIGASGENTPQYGREQISEHLSKADALGLFREWYFNTPIDNQTKESEIAFYFEAGYQQGKVEK